MNNVNVQQTTMAMGQLNQELASMTRLIRDMVAAQSAHQRTQNVSDKKTQNVNDELTQFSKQLRSGRKVNEEQLRLIDEAVSLKRRELRIAQAYALAKAKANSIDAKDTDAKDKATKRASDIDKRLKAQQALTAAATDKVTKSFEKLELTANLASNALAWFGKTVSAQAKQIAAQNKVSGGLIEGTDSLVSALAEQQSLALSHRMDAATFANITNASRQMFNSMGGTSKGMDTLGDSFTSFSIAMGSYEDGLRMATQTAQAFAMKGIKPTAGLMEQYRQDLNAVRRQTGLSVEQSHQLYDSIASDIESIDLLRSARAGERQAILQSQRALIQQSIAAGMSAEQAREAAKMLNKMVAAKPLDRLKQAARVRAMSGAMGIAGGEEAAQAIIAGKRATPEQQAALQRFSQNAANTMDTVAGQGLATELFATTLVDKLDLEHLYGKNSPFSTTLGDSLQSSMGDLSKAYVDTTQTESAKVIEKLVGISKQIELVLTGQHWLGPIAASVALIAAIAARGKLMTMGKEAFNKVKGYRPGGTPTPTTGSPKLAPTGAPAAAPSAVSKAGDLAGKVGGVASETGALAKLAPMLKGLGWAGMIADIGFGAKDLYEGKKQTELPQGMDSISPMRWSMYISNKIEEGFKSLTKDTVGEKISNVNNANDPNAVQKLNPPIPQTQPLIKPEDKAKHDKVEAATLDAAQTNVDAVNQQTQQVGQTNNILKQLIEISQKQLTVSEKSLTAQMLTDTEKAEAATSSPRDSRFNTRYGSL